MSTIIQKNYSLHTVFNEDCINILKELPNNSVQLIIADPPYNINIESWDNFNNYLEWAKEWIHEAERVLKNEGNFVIFGGFQFENPERGDLIDLIYYIRRNTNFRVVNVITWYYKNGISARRFFSNRHEEIVWLVKGKKYIFNLDDVRIKYDEKTLDLYKKDKRLNINNLIKGKNPTNVWEIARLNSNSKERVGHPTQKPQKIIERLVKALSNEGDVVLDIFAGSAITTKVCIENNRNSISCDIDKEFLKYVELQLLKLNKNYSYKITPQLDTMIELTNTI